VTKSRQLNLDRACVAYEKGRFVPALRAFQALADQGNEVAFFMLGYVYDVGRGARTNRAKAVHWYIRAYKAHGSSAAAAASNLATIYRDLGRSRLEFQWYERAADIGDGDALLEIGIRYLAGKGVKRSPSLAVEHFKAAAKSKRITEAARDTALQLLVSCRRWPRARIA
jgi:uncharacterized protein